ncbi:zinc ribbon domain-containing protein [Silvibacterium sp.]|uniref:zinc ribbon domain-containing protein n=1 Tax=Silvibacterium sp. TaxID=1964179 RepID=UPI0039E62E52
MFCSACGQPISPGQGFCTRCGRPAVAAAAGTPPANWQAAQAYAAQPYPTQAGVILGRVQRHLQSLSVLWIAYAVWTLFQWGIAMSFFGGFFGNYFGHWHHGPFGDMPMAHMAWLGPVISITLFGRAVLYVVTGIGLSRRAPWARVLAIVTAFLTIWKLFLGTALAIYTLWALMPSASGEEYRQIESHQPVL